MPMRCSSLRSRGRMHGDSRRRSGRCHALAGVRLINRLAGAAPAAGAEGGLMGPSTHLLPGCPVARMVDVGRAWPQKLPRPRPMTTRRGRGVRLAAYRHSEPRLLPQGGRLPMGVPRPYARAGIYPDDRRRPLCRCVHGQLVFQRLPRHPRPHLRPALRAGLPPRPGRRGAGGDLPPQARGRRLQGRHNATACPAPPSAPTASELPWSAPAPPR